MLSVENVKALLQDRNVTTVAEASGVDIRVLYRIRANKAKTIDAEDYRKLCLYFEQQMAGVGYVPAENLKIAGAAAAN